MAHGASAIHAVQSCFISTLILKSKCSISQVIPLLDQVLRASICVPACLVSVRGADMLLLHRHIFILSESMLNNGA